MASSLYWVLLLPWLAVFTSQTLVDVSDIILVSFTVVSLTKTKSWSSFLKLFQPAVLWVVWLTVIMIGLLINNLAANPSNWLVLLEFKWIFSFLCLIYLFQKIDLEIFTKKYLLKILLVLNAVALVLYFVKSDDRAGGILNQVMSFSHNIAPVGTLFTLLFLGLWKSLNQSERAQLFLVASSSILLSLLTITRGVWIGIFAGLALGALLISRRIFLIVCFGMSLVFTGVWFSSNKVVERLSFDASVKESSNYVRVQLYKANLLIAKEHPFFGVGYAQNKVMLPEYYKKLGYTEGGMISHAHNQYLEFLANTGLFGLLCFLVFIGLIYKYGFWALKIQMKPFDRIFLIGLLGAQTCFLVGSVTECNFNVSKNRFLFLVLSACVVSIYHKSFKPESLSN